MDVKPGYKMTEVGVIPEEWDIRQLKECCHKLNVGFVGTCEPFYTKESCGVLMLRTGNLHGDKIVLDDIKFVTREFHTRNRKSQVRAGDIVIARHGNSGNAVSVPPEIDDVNALSIVILRTNDQILDNRFACYCINSGAVRSQASEMVAGSTQVIINTKEIAKLLLQLPPAPEQRAIAEALRDVDALLDSLDRLIAKKRDLKQAAMQQLLTGQTRLPGFHGEWEVKRLGDVVEIRKGQLITSNTTKTGGIPVIAGGKQPAYYHDVANRQGRTITISASGASAGYIAIYNTPIFASDCSTISEGPSYSIDFIYYQLLLRQQLIYNAQTGGAQPHIHAIDLMPIEVITPPLPEQTAIAAVLSDMDAEISALEQQRSKTRALKQGMMQELLTGRIRLI